MRDPHRWRTIGLWCLGVGTLSLAWLWVGAGYSAGVRGALIFFGAVGVVFGGWLALFGHQDVRAKQALGRGEDIIARWRVEAEDWQRFLALNRQWPSGANGRLNEFIPSEAAEPNGVEVIVRPRDSAEALPCSHLAEGSRQRHFVGFAFFTADFLAPFFARLFPLPMSALAAW